MKKNILLVSLQKSGGVALDFLNFTKGLSEKGFFHTACISFHNEFRDEHEQINNSDILLVRTHSSRTVDFLVSIFLLRPFVFFLKIVKTRADIVHVANFHPWIFLLYAVRPFCRFKILYACHDNPFRPKEPHPPVMDVLERFFARHADAVIAYSSFARDDIQSYISRNVFILPLIVPELAYGALNKKPLAKELRILFFGRIETYKGIDTLVDAFEILHNEKIPISLTLAGRGDIPLSLREKISLLGIHLLNSWISNEDLVSLLESTDIVAAPYKTATQSAVVLLALSYGIPVIATNTGSISEYVRDGYNGLLIEPNKPHELASCIRKIDKDRKVLGYVSKNSAEIREKFSPRHVAEIAIDIYRSF